MWLGYGTDELSLQMVKGSLDNTGYSKGALTALRRSWAVLERSPSFSCSMFPSKGMSVMVTKLSPLCCFTHWSPQRNDLTDE